MRHLITGLMISAISTAAFAVEAVPPTVELPEPGTLGLLGASVAALIAVRKFRK